MAAAVLYREQPIQNTGTTSPQLPSSQDRLGYLRLIDDSHHIQPSNSTSIFRSLTLSIIEVGWHSNNSMGNLNKETNTILL